MPLRCDALARNSSPGLFEGYDFDTLGTRGMLDVPTLGLLGKYRRVIWYVDQAAANYAGCAEQPDAAQVDAPLHERERAA